MQEESPVGVCPSSAAAISYTFLRHFGLMLDELSSQGLEVWCDERQVWRCRWTAIDLKSERGFWALGEAIVDAVVMRYLVAFESTAVDGIE